MRVLVTGGAGFIGSHVQDMALALGHKVAILDDMSSGKKENINAQAKFYHLDIRSPEVKDIFSEFQPEVLFHLAAQMDVRKSVADPKFDCDVNGLGLLNLLEAGRQHGLKKVIFSSTGGAIYGEQDYFPADEKHPLRPLSPYGITKLLSEKYLFFYRETYGIDYLALRYANVYGPRQNPHGEAGVVAIFAQRMLKGETVTIHGDGLQTRDYVFVDDVVKANELALKHDLNGEFNVGTGIETSVNQIQAGVAAAIPGSPDPVHGPAKAGEQQRSVLDCNKIERELGWKAQVKLEEGLARTVEFFRSNA